jgi:hypothetical protein
MAQSTVFAAHHDARGQRRPAMPVRDGTLSAIDHRDDPPVPFGRHCNASAHAMAIASPMPRWAYRDVRLVPTGGVTLDTRRGLLDCPNVVAWGGSWLAPAALLRERRWEAVGAAVAEALAVSRGASAGFPEKRRPGHPAAGHLPRAPGVVSARKLKRATGRFRADSAFAPSPISPNRRVYSPGI